MKAVLLVPSFDGVMGTMLHFAEHTLLVICCNWQAAEGDGQKIATVFVVVRADVSRLRQGFRGFGGESEGTLFLCCRCHGDDSRQNPWPPGRGATSIS